MEFEEKRLIVIESQYLTLRFRSILKRCGQIAKDKKYPMNAEPLILAILEEQNCDEVRALNELGVTSETFHAALLKIRGFELKDGQKVYVTKNGKRVTASKP